MDKKVKSDWNEEREKLGSLENKFVRALIEVYQEEGRFESVDRDVFVDLLRQCVDQVISENDLYEAFKTYGSWKNKPTIIP